MKVKFISVLLVASLGLLGCKKEDDSQQAVDRTEYKMERVSGFKVMQFTDDVDLRLTGGPTGGAGLSLRIPLGGSRVRRAKRKEKKRLQLLKRRTEIDKTENTEKKQ